MRKLSFIILIMTGALGAGGSASFLAAANAAPAASAPAASAPAASAGQAAGTVVPSQRSMRQKMIEAQRNQESAPVPASAPVSAPPVAP